MLQSIAHRHTAPSRSDYCVLSMTNDVYQDLLKLDEALGRSSSSAEKPPQMLPLPKECGVSESSWNLSSAPGPLEHLASTSASTVLDSDVPSDLSFLDDSWQSSDLVDWSVLFGASVLDPLPLFSDGPSFTPAVHRRSSGSFDDTNPGLVDSLSSHSNTPLPTPSSSALPLPEPQFTLPHTAPYPSHSDVISPQPALQFAMSQAQRSGFMDRFLNIRQFMTPPDHGSPQQPAAPLQQPSSQYLDSQAPYANAHVQLGSVAASMMPDQPSQSTASTNVFDFAVPPGGGPALRLPQTFPPLFDFSFLQAAPEDVNGKRKLEDELPLLSPKRAKVEEDPLLGFEWDPALELLPDTQQFLGETSGSGPSSFLDPQYDFMTGFDPSSSGFDLLNNSYNFDSNVLSLDVVDHTERF